MIFDFHKRTQRYIITSLKYKQNYKTIENQIYLKKRKHVYIMQNNYQSLKYKEKLEYDYENSKMVDRVR